MEGNHCQSKAIGCARDKVWTGQELGVFKDNTPGTGCTPVRATVKGSG